MRIRLGILLWLACIACVWAQNESGDSLGMEPMTLGADSLLADSLSATPKPQARLIVKREFNPHAQVLVGTLIMTLMVLIITTTGNWNP